MIISVSYYFYIFLLYLSMDVRILTQPTALQCRKDFSVGGGVTSKAAIFRGKALLNGGNFGNGWKWWFNGVESHLMGFLKMLRIPTK